MRKVVRIILSVITVVLVMALVMALFLVFSQNSGKTPYLYGYTGFINTGTSMLPLIKEGDFIIVKKQEYYEKDDVISYKSADLVVTHRIDEVQGDYYKTKGDNNKFVDGDTVSRLSVYGKMVAKVPRVGIIIIFLMLHKAWVIGGLTIAILLFIAFRIGLSYVRGRNS